MDRFKTPSLRGLAARPPYFHNGIAANLTEVVRHYEIGARVRVPGPGARGSGRVPGSALTMVSRRYLLTVLVCTLWLVATAARADGQGACAKEAATKTWQRASLEGVELEYRTVGVGEPVVLVHAGVFADWFEPLLKEPSLSRRYCLVTYHRVGYAGSSHVAGPVSIAQQAAHVRALMQLLGIDRAHLVGHSSGANIIMQLALDAPQKVRSLALLEMALPVPAGSPGRARDSPSDGALSRRRQGRSSRYVHARCRRPRISRSRRSSAARSIRSGSARTPIRSSARSCRRSSNGLSARRRRRASSNPCCS